MKPYRFTVDAKTDLRSIWSYIAEDNLEAARRVRGAIYDACSFLASTPFGGHLRAELTKLPLRFWIVSRFPNYVIVYDPATKPLKIIRVFHGAKNIRRILKSGN